MAVVLASCGSSAGDGGTDDSRPSTDASADVDVLANGCVEGASFRGGVVCTSDTTTCSSVIRVLSYNVHALPELVSGENPKDRMRRIGEILADQRGRGLEPDFVLLQEAFDKQDRLIDRAAYASALSGPTQEAGIDSGLYILTDHEVVRHDSESYDDCAAEDCLSEKGVTAIETAIDGLPEPIVILTTHLQAQSENDAVRVEQINQLLPYLETQGIGSKASVFAGDFNFKAKPDHDAHPSYAHFVDQTPFVPAGKACLEDDQCTVEFDANVADENDMWLSTNDHQFFVSPEPAALDIVIVRAALSFTEPFEGDPLSDHWAKEFDYCVSWQP